MTFNNLITGLSRYWFYFKLFLRRFFNHLSFVCYYIVDTAVLFTSAPKLRQGTGIVKLDAIGDHILFRNLFQYLHEDEEQLFLIIPSNLKNLYENLDNGRNEKLIIVDLNKFNINIRYRLNKLIEIRKLALKTIIIASNSKRTLLEDALIRCSDALQKIGPLDTGNNMPKLLIHLTSKWYTQIIKTSPNIMFEHLRNVDFISQLKQRQIQPQLQIKLSTNKNEIFVIFPGAGRPYRMWSVENFKKVAEWLTLQKKMRGVILGAKADFKLGEIIKSANQAEITNLCGQVSLFESIKITSSARINLCNESGPSHIGAALGTQTISISNGNHYGRFHPYPSSLHKPITHIYPPLLNQELTKKGVNYVVNKYRHISTLNINSITPEQVIFQIEKLF